MDVKEISPDVLKGRVDQKLVFPDQEDFNLALEEKTPIIVFLNERLLRYYHHLQIREYNWRQRLSGELVNCLLDLQRLNSEYLGKHKNSPADDWRELYDFHLSAWSIFILFLEKAGEKMPLFVDSVYRVVLTPLGPLKMYIKDAASEFVERFSEEEEFKIQAALLGQEKKFH